MDDVYINSKIQVHKSEFICDECKKPYGSYTFSTLVRMMFMDVKPLTKKELSKIICTCNWKNLKKTTK